MSFDKPARHMREYLSILMPLLHEGSVNFAGETLTYRGPGPGARRPAAPGGDRRARRRACSRLAGEVADGTITWMTGPATIADHIAPSINKAAEGPAARRPGSSRRCR